MVPEDDPRPYQRLVRGGGGSGGGGGGGYTTMRGFDERKWQSPFPTIANQTCGLTEILLAIIAVMLGLVVIVILIGTYVFSSNSGTVYTVSKRLEVVENLARNVNDATQVMRRALGERSLDDPGLPMRDIGDGSGWKNWLEDRGTNNEALITNNAVQIIVRGVRTLVRISEQIESSKLMAAGARFVDHADQVLTGPEMTHIIQAVDTAVQHPQAQSVASQTMDLVAHVESAVLPVVDALAVEIRQRISELLEGGPDGYTAHQLTLMLHEMVDVTHKLGVGMRDFVVWYRTGGPADAIALMDQLVRTSRELLESPAASSLVHLLEGVDWSVTGNHMAESAHNVAAILRAINDAGTVDSGDRLIRAVAGLLEDPGTKKVLNLLPGIAANATALLARPNAQRLIEHGSALMGRVDAVLGEAETTRTVERTAEFLSTLRLLLGALIDGGMHLEVGLPGPGSGNGGGGYLERDSKQPQQQHEASLLDGVPRITNYEPERTRYNRGPPR